MNKLFFGDNLDILKSSIPSESIDLIYLDPPFNSGKNYNILFKPEKETTKGATAQIQTFEDTWHWGKQAEDEYQGIIDGTICKEQPSQAIINLIQSYRSYLGECPMMAYLAMMTPRLIELHRVLKGTGSFYLHCDPTASHYLKLLLDAIFGIKNFRNEIVWHYRKWSTKQAQFCSNHDILFFYSKTDTKDRVFVHPFMDRAESTKKRFGNSKIISGHDENGRRLPSETENFDSEGVPMDDVWEIGRVPPIKQLYSTQKPEILLERIIKASSNVGRRFNLRSILWLRNSNRSCSNTKSELDWY